MFTRGRRLNYSMCKLVISFFLSFFLFFSRVVVPGCQHLPDCCTIRRFVLFFWGRGVVVVVLNCYRRSEVCEPAILRAQTDILHFFTTVTAQKCAYSHMDENFELACEWTLHVSGLLPKGERTRLMAGGKNKKGPQISTVACKRGRRAASDACEPVL